MDNINEIAKLGQKLTGIRVTIDYNRATSFNIHWEIDDKFINLNPEEIEDLWYSSLEDRGFSYEYMYLQALLHEIAHYKQWIKYAKQNKKVWDSWCLDSLKDEFLENQADRFARMYYRRFI